MPDTFASTFSGFGGADIGAHRAGLQTLWGVEYEDPIAAVARANGLPTLTADVLTTDWRAMESPYWYHTSPPCPSFSVASQGKETEADLALADAVCESVRVLRSPYVSLENVRGYVGSESLRRILRTLDDEGYLSTHGILCAADYGIPQTRHRLVVVASRIAAPKLPTPTHAETPGPTDLFGYAPAAWVGWHEAIVDLLPGLPNAELAPWQRKRLPEEWATLLISSNTAGGKGCPVPHRTEPALTVDTKAERVRAVMVSGENANGTPFRDRARRSGTITSTNSVPTALLVDGALNAGSSLITTLDGVRRANTVTTSKSRAAVRAVLVHTGNTSDVQAAPGVGCLDPARPSNTVYAKPPTIGAVLTAPHVRTVRLSPRCLARFQDFPDTYELPDSSTLAVKGIGNAVPPGLLSAVIRANL